MLSPSLYSRELIVIHEELHYEVCRVLGQPILLMHGETGQPLASLHYLVPTSNNTFTDQVTIAPERNRDYDELKAISNRPSATGIVSLLVTNLLFDEPIGWEIEGRHPEPLIVPPGKTMKWDYCLAEWPTFRTRFTTMLGNAFEDAIYTRKQLICRPRIPLNHEGLPAMMDHPAIVGGDGSLVKSAQMTLENDDPEQFFTQGCKWISLKHEVTEHLVIPPNMSRKYTLKKSMALVEECIVNKNQRLLERCKGIYPSDECVVCLDGTPDCVITPCGHKCAHRDCLDGMEDEKCPICRSAIVIKLFN